MPVGETVDLKGAWLLPGFVDQHCHGGGQGDFFSLAQGDPERGARMHLEHGTTSLMASLVTATTVDLLAQIDRLSPLVDDGTFVGIHLEGPWISPHQCGAHDASLLRAPDISELETLFDAGAGRVMMVTIAPELPGAIEAIEYMVGRGVVAAVGHTEADYETTLLAIDAGATVATHLLNRMPPVGKREPGPVVALLEDPRVVVEIIADGVHVHPAVFRLFANASGPDRVAIVTDAMGAAGASDGSYLIGALDVDVRGGVARLASSGALAGSTLTMDRGLRLALSAGIPVEQAAALVAANPARAMGLDDRGELTSGKRADLVVLDDHMNVTDVMRGGEWVVGPRA